MRLGDIDFPPGLIEAIRDGKLVVFAGAGVSKGPPANLPLFDELADKIAEGSGGTQREGEAIDQFLGRLASEHGTKVNKIAADLLTAANPQPSELHKNLIRLFKGEAADVRLVTTNFDLLFEAAAAEVLSENPTVFRASALPRGDEFAGIVHVHGDVTLIADMVLTDADFGRAYLTGGWARRFLVSLFQTNPVLFVGYSHGDTIMEYLARAMPVPPDIPHRFILTEVEDAAYWARLGIRPIMFPKGAFHVQNESVAKLATAVNRGAADWSDFIRDAVNSTPTALSDEDAEILKFGLVDAEDPLTNVRVFSNYANSFEWVTWLDQRDILVNLFDGGEFDDKASLLAWWIASKFALQDADALFRLIGQMDLRLHPQFWYRLAFEVGVGDTSHLTPEGLGRWVSVLLSKAVGVSHLDFASIFERCVEFGRLEDALDVLEMVARPNIKGLSLVSEKTFGDAEVRIASDNWHLAQMKSALLPHMPDVADRLASVTIRHLANQHRTLVTWDRADRNFSQPSLRRETIVGEKGDDESTSEDVLVDMARDSLVWLAKNKPRRAEVWIKSLGSSDVPLLRRLARIALISLQE